MVDIDPEDDAQLRAYFHSETAQIPWSELQRYFAQGIVLQVDPELDLVEVAFQLARDNRDCFEAWIAEQKIAHVQDTQAQVWVESEATVWAVVAAPWVLVQNRNG